MKNKISQYVKFTTKIVHRSKLKNAPYNPRTISDEARAKLKRNIIKTGLIEPPIWNKKTGNIVGGHQRLSVLDTLHKTKDYYLPVAMVSFSLKKEKEQNIFLNNAETQGDFDIEKLGAMFKEGINVENTGFNNEDIYKIFGDSPQIHQPEQLEAMSETIKRITEEHDKKVKEKMERDNPEFYSILIFPSYKMRKKFTDLLNLSDNRYINGKKVYQIIKKTIGDA